MSVRIKIARLLNIFAKAFGFHLLRRNYNLPIPENSDMKYAAISELPGLNIDPDKCLAFLDKTVLKYKKEFNAFPTDESVNGYHLLNNSFMAIDGNAYYSLVRELKPKTIIEIGSGFSTKLAVEAVRKNYSESSPNADLISIEPYPPEFLTKYKEIKLYKKPVQEIGLEIFESLGENDILFIDSSHALKSGGDVWYEYCEILPRLKPGVYVHIHDISLPKPYPRIYFDDMLYWNEQYMLQAYLINNSKIEIVWPGNYLMCNYKDKMEAAFEPEYKLMRKKFPHSEPSSFWFKTI